MKKIISFVILALMGLAPPAWSAGVVYDDIAANGNNGLQYSRVPSERQAFFDAAAARATLGPGFDAHTLGDILTSALKSRGAPGIAVLDYDLDGDLDLYVTNGPGAPNSLFQSQLMETGMLSFVDVAAATGVEATAQDSNGVCYGDIDNDGDPDLLVLGGISGLPTPIPGQPFPPFAGTQDPNRTFENNGNGTFTDISNTSGLNGGPLPLFSTSCTMGDVNSDGLLDVAIANAFRPFDFFPIFAEPFGLNQPNQLFINTGVNQFVDASASSGILVTKGFRGPQGDFDSDPQNPFPTITWALSLVDYDQDGDLDLIHTDDQGGFPILGKSVTLPPSLGGVTIPGIDRAILHVFQNDGTGHFTDVSRAVGSNNQGQYMSTSFGDINCDDSLDMFITNIGDWMQGQLDPVNYEVGDATSRWVLGLGDGLVQDGKNDALSDFGATPFGWGAVIEDYDNDGDHDIIYHGGLFTGAFADASNPGIVFDNQDCSGSFQVADVLSTTNHQLRNVQGVASGDLNNDGFVDLISVSNFDSAPILVPYTRPDGSLLTYGSPFDPVATIINGMPVLVSGAGLSPTYLPCTSDLQPPFPTNIALFGVPGCSPLLDFAVDPSFAFNSQLPPATNGSLSVEINSADNDNNWLAINVVGTTGITDNGRTPRDGIGAVLRFTPVDGQSSTKPVVAGSSYASQNSLTTHFGMGEAKMGTLDVLWPGGVHNRLYNVKQSSTVVFPEIPCSIDANLSSDVYAACVNTALDEIVDTGIIGLMEAALFRSSALRAFAEES